MGELPAGGAAQPQPVLSTANRGGGHSIRLTIETGAYNTAAQFTCYESDGADCHTACERSQCEEGCLCAADGLEPQPKDWGECLLCTWLDNNGTWEEQYCGPRVDARSGPIVIDWQKDGYYTWRYADDS